MTTRYVCGFAFSSDLEKLLLIRKARPEWQAGRLNGLGGEIRSGERPVDAMVREFLEESGLSTTPSHWDQRLVLNGPIWKVVFFTTRLLRADLMRLHGHDAGGGEFLDVVPLWDTRWQFDALPNLRWLIPLCLDKTVSSATVSDCTVEGKPYTGPVCERGSSCPGAGCGEVDCPNARSAR